MTPEIPAKEATQHVSIRLPVTVVRLIDSEAKKKNRSRSVVMATLLKWALEAK